MRASGNFLRNNKGVTLVEIMMALAVFGIVMLVFASAIRGYSRINSDNLDRMRMAELARAITEVVKADPDNYPGDGIDYSVPCLPAGDSHPKYAASYMKIKDSTGLGEILKITVGPEGEDPSSHPDRFVLVGWLPNTGEGFVPTPDPGTGGLSDPYNPENWIYSNGDSYNENDGYWYILPGGISRTSKGGTGQGTEERTNYIFYKSPFNTFDFTVNLVFDKLSSVQNSGTGIVLKIYDDESYDTDKYIYYMYGDHKKDPKVSLNFIKVTQNGSEVQPGFPIDTDVPLTTSNKYYLRAIMNPGGSLTLKFGLCDQPGNPQSPASSVDVASFNPSLSSDYLLGLFDETPGSVNSVFTISSSANECKLQECR